MHRFKGYWWSPDSQTIAFTHVDESPVELSQRYEIDADSFGIPLNVKDAKKALKEVIEALRSSHQVANYDDLLIGFLD